MIRSIAIWLTGVIAALLVLAVTRPAVFRVEPSTRISSPPEKIFHYVNELHQWGVWSAST